MDAAGIPEKEFADISARFRAMHTEACMWRIVRDGTHDALERLKSAGFKLGIVSNADGRVAGDAKRLGLAKFFDVIIDSQVVGVEKPNPKIFQLALDALGVPPEEAMYAGDIYAIDMLGARAAGISGKLIDQHGMYHWIEHPKIRHVGELHLSHPARCVEEHARAALWVQFARPRTNFSPANFRFASIIRSLSPASRRKSPTA